MRAAGFSVASRTSLSLHVNGSVGAVEQAFGVQLSHGLFADGKQRLVADHALKLSTSLAAAGAHIAQFTTAPAFQKQSYIEDAKKGPPPNFDSATGPYFTDDLRQAYDYPSVSDLDASGVTIGILMEGDWNEQSVGGPDMVDYFEAELASAYVPNITTIPVGGGAPFSVSGSGETHLDIQQSSGMALGATEILYNLGDLTPAMVLAGLGQIDEDNSVDVVNQSFGFPEVGFTAATNNNEDLTWILIIMDELYQQGNLQGITFVASSGDHGAIPPDFNCTSCSHAVTLSVLCPACDPNVTAVGGTNLVTAFTPKSNNSAYVSENANFDKQTETKGEVWGSGGGIDIPATNSTIFAKPTWQQKAVAGFTTPGTTRTVPDLALHMGGCGASFSGFVQPCGANRSHDWEYIGGQPSQVIGTSASSPDFAGLVALMVNLNGGSPTGRQGNMNPYIYRMAKANGTKAFHHAKIVGSNDGPNSSYRVKAPYDLVIGNGTVDAREFMGATSLQASGIPGTASNP